MDKKQLDMSYQNVSVELSNPFPALGQYSLNKLKQFCGVTTAYIQGIFRANEEAFANTLSFRTSTLVDDQLRQKKVIYTDIQPVTVYTPTILKPNVYMLVFVSNLQTDMEFTKKIMSDAPDQMISMIQMYIGNPALLQDVLTLPRAMGHSLTSTWENDLKAHRARNEKLLTSTGTQSERPFKQVYARVVDFQETVNKTRELHEAYSTQVSKLQSFIQRVDAASSSINELLTLIQTKPDVYKVSSKVGQRLTIQMRLLAELSEFAASTLYNTQLAVKAVSDTIRVLEKAVE